VTRQGTELQIYDGETFRFKRKLNWETQGMKN
jgi:hypothetical protein